MSDSPLPADLRVNGFQQGFRTAAVLRQLPDHHPGGLAGDGESRFPADGADAVVIDLPAPVQHVLPEHGLDIYRKAFNNAWKQYKDPDSRRTPESREEVCHKVAWNAVKKKYHKAEDGSWQPY